MADNGYDEFVKREEDRSRRANHVALHRTEPTADTIWRTWRLDGSHVRVTDEALQRILVNPTSFPAWLLRSAIDELIERRRNDA